MKEKYLNYAATISGAIGSMFEDDSEWHIDLKELNEGDNLTQFIHALANTVPTYFFNKFTSDELNQLDFNHIANKLCFQFSNKEQSEDEQAEKRL